MLPDSSVPLYIQLKELLQEAMRDGTLPPGSRVPSERELAQRYSVSRMTARQALQMLAHEGLIYSRVGKGTYVSEPKIPQELQALTSFTEEMARLGLRAESKVLRAEVQPASADVSRHLRLPPGAPVVTLLRVRCASGVPMALEQTSIDHALCPNILQNHDFSRASLYEVMRHDYGVSVVLAEQLIETRLPQTYECDVLGIDHMTPILSIERTTFDAEHRAVEFVRSVYRGDKYRFKTVLRAREWVAAPVTDVEN